MSSYPLVFITVDLQNDLCHAEGVFKKHGLIIPQVENIIPHIVETIHFCRKIQIPIIATQLTILEGLKKESFKCGTFKDLTPILEKEGFRDATWGHDLIEEIPKVDFTIKKWGISSFYQTELARYLSAFDCEEIVLAGFTTNGAVETLAREAVGRNYKICTLIDCVASYSEALHGASLTNLRAFGNIFNTQEWQNLITEQYNRTK